MNQNFVKLFDFFFLDLGIVGNGILSREDRRIYTNQKNRSLTLALK